MYLIAINTKTNVVFTGDDGIYLFKDEDELFDSFLYSRESTADYLIYRIDPKEYFINLSLDEA